VKGVSIARQKTMTRRKFAQNLKIIGLSADISDKETDM
jgi:hypothetical protein